MDHHEWFGDEVLDFKYILINVNSYDEAQLKRLSNLIGTVFLLDREKDAPSFVRQLERMSEVIEKLPQELFQMFQTWIKIATTTALSTSDRNKLTEIVNSFTDPKEAKAMISNVEKIFEDYYHNAELKGLEQGLEKGREEGAEQAAIRIATRLLGKGVDLDTIVEATGLTKERIQKLQK